MRNGCGGLQNQVLNQLAAGACQQPVVTGPVEAMAMGYLLTQVRASGELASLADMRAVIHKPSDLGRFEPKQSAVCREGERFGELRGSGAW